MGTHRDDGCHNDMTMWKIVRGFVETHTAVFVLFLLCIVAVPLQDVLIPHLAGKLYQSVREKKMRSMVWPILLIIFGVIVLIQVIDTIDDKLDTFLFPTMQHYVRELMMNHQFETNSTDYQDVHVGQTVMYMYKLPSNVYVVIEIWKNKIVPQTVALLVCTAYVAWLMPTMGILLLVVVLVSVAVAAWRFRTCCDYSNERDAMHSEIVGSVDDIISNMRTVISFGKQDEQLALLSEEHDAYAELAEKTLDCVLVVKLVSIPLLLLFIAVLVYVCFTKKAQPEHVTLTLLIIAFIVCKSMFSLFYAYRDIVGKMGSIDNALQVFDVCPSKANEDLKDSGDLISSFDGSKLDKSACIQIVDLSYRYVNRGRPIFEHLDLSFERGKATAVVGDIGSGKSTLISLLMRFQRPDSGQIFLDGVPYDRVDPADLRRRVFLLPQSPLLFNRSVYDNIVFGVDRYVPPEEVQALVRSLGLGDFVEKAGGLDKIAGIRGGKLSGGQRQIVWLLKMFLIDPEVAVLDEPTASLDPETKVIVARLVVRAMRDGRTLIISTHDKALMDEADVVVRL